jgi:hypothetical protein
MPKINKNSHLIESRKSAGHQIPRYEILLEMGRMYSLDREQKQLAMFHSEEAIYANDEDLSEDMRQFAAEKADEQKQFRDVVMELKNSNFSPQNIEYVEEYQTPDNNPSDNVEHEEYE